eukprot:CAMPEP_0185756606 /NCGR_PEP_ID=MMETSP1174-20130828/15023_1 /TAXON_ID=35687 /ORGANISM="Dictyocha speculum, Strain CCMP1381" /LENGTH=174 /DNA_ID=CAMNT_0028435633 /DNA_START=77 /DNA_END=601 /DNA_ORIENTATION=+
MYTGVAPQPLEQALASDPRSTSSLISPACPCAVKKDGATPMYIAAHQGHVDAIKALAELGADVNESQKNGATPVLIAAHQGHMDAIKLVYKLGADMKPDCRWSATYLARAIDHIEAVKRIEKIRQKLTSECEFCGSSSKRLKKWCEIVRYCSRECQVKDYKKHKNECNSSNGNA